MCRHDQSDALSALSVLLKPVNTEAAKPIERRWTLKELIYEAYLPYCRRKWKESTAETTEDRIQYYLVRDLGKMEIRNITREMLQCYLEKKTKSGLSHSVLCIKTPTRRVSVPLPTGFVLPHSSFVVSGT